MGEPNANSKARERKRFSKPLSLELGLGEHICSKVPILVWPIMADQPLNARKVEEEIKIGLRVETSDGSVKGFVKLEGLKKG